MSDVARGPDATGDTGNAVAEPAQRRSRRMTAGFVGVVAVVALPLVAVDVIIPLLAGPYLVRSFEVSMPWTGRGVFAAFTVGPLLGLAWLAIGTWVAARRFRAGSGRRRWLVPVLVPVVCHLVLIVGLQLLGGLAERA